MINHPLLRCPAAHQRQISLAHLPRHPGLAQHTGGMGITGKHQQPRRWTIQAMHRIDVLPAVETAGILQGKFRFVAVDGAAVHRSEEHTSELQSRENLVCRLLLEKKKTPETRGEGEKSAKTPRPAHSRAAAQWQRGPPTPD